MVSRSHTTRKNPIAKDLRTPKYRKRVTKDKTVYTRKEKHNERILHEADNTGIRSDT
jgi:stalled ribosome alternative rescue factor ArfA